MSSCSKQGAVPASIMVYRMVCDPSLSECSVWIAFSYVRRSCLAASNATSCLIAPDRATAVSPAVDSWQILASAVDALDFVTLFGDVNSFTRPAMSSSCISAGRIAPVVPLHMRAITQAQVPPTLGDADPIKRKRCCIIPASTRYYAR